MDGRMPQNETSNDYDAFIDFNSYDDLVLTIESTKGRIIVMHFRERVHGEIVYTPVTQATIHRLTEQSIITVLYRLPSMERRVGPKINSPFKPF